MIQSEARHIDTPLGTGGHAGAAALASHLVYFHGLFHLPLMYIFNEGDDIDLYPSITPENYTDVTGFEETCLKALACHRSQGMHLPARQNRLWDKWKVWGQKSGNKSAEGFIEIV